MTRLSDAPKVSVVTPSFNQGRFIRQAIDSVQAQTYPHIEHVVVDGGSTDETLEILRSYGDRINWSSRPDAGQSDAINRGFAATRGEILAWLNTDDVYPRPDAVERAVDELVRHPQTGLVFGRGVILDESGAETGPFVELEPFNLWRLLYMLDTILQPATFFRRSAFEAVGGLDLELHYAMDWDLWLRLVAHAEVRFIDHVLGGSREYGDTKTATGGWRRIRELGRLMRHHTGRRWTPGVRLYALDTLRLQLRAQLPALAGRIDSLIAFASRRILEGVPVHADGWLGPRSHLVVPRRWPAFQVEFEVHRLPKQGPLVIELKAEGRRVGCFEAEQPGVVAYRCELPPVSAGPFVRIDVQANVAFRTLQDRRLLAVRCLGLQSSPPAQS
ncbi:MAG: glycosyltransferase family 2 protein [Acidobacteriota bacterium]